MIFAKRLTWTLLAGWLLAGAVVNAQVFEKLHSFREPIDGSGGVARGSMPKAALIEGSDGNFYGTTSAGGSGGAGAIIKVTPDGEMTTMVSFTGMTGASRGAVPCAALTRGADGSFYGTTREGGAYGLGTVYRMSPSGDLTTLVEFTGNLASNKGSYPEAELIQANDGNFYGTTSEGGTSAWGTIFRMTPAGGLTTLVNFTDNGASNKGRTPKAPLVQASDTLFYGTTAGGGTSGRGTVFSVTTAGTLTTLVNFTGNGATNKGANPRGRLVRATNGDYYGTTFSGGGSLGIGDNGSVFRMTPAGALTTLLIFSDNGTNKGMWPMAGLTPGIDGNLYGTTSFGGGGGGTVFRINVAAGTLTTLLTFNSAANLGFAPECGLLAASDGFFYGCTSHKVFRMSPSGTAVPLAAFGLAGTPAPVGLSKGTDGKFYGVFQRGGDNDHGSLFSITPAGKVTTLYHFTTDRQDIGIRPGAGVLQTADGTLYGTTGELYGEGLGTMFKRTPAGGMSSVLEFTDFAQPYPGSIPLGRLVFGVDGAMYGTTYSGGSNGDGTLYKLTTAGVFTSLASFVGGTTGNARGRYPVGALAQHTDNSFYGTTTDGGSAGFGTVFKSTPAGVITTLQDFTGNGTGNKGRRPNGGLVKAGDGNFYGTTYEGGSFGYDAPNFRYGYGTVFRLTPAGALTTPVEFTDNGASNKGRNPGAGLVLGGDGHLYGTTLVGGSAGRGTVFRMTTAGVLTTLFDFAGDPQDGTPTELVVGDDGNIYGVAASCVFRLIFPGPPNVNLAGVTHQGTTAVVLTAHVNPRGASTTTTLEYGTDGTTFPNTLSASPTLLSGHLTTLVGATLSSLTSGQTYYYRARSVSSAGTSVSEVGVFTALAAPTVVATAASGLAQTSVVLNGSVNARAFDTSVTFQWGTDGNSFPHSIAATPGTVTGSTAVNVSQAVAGLTKGTTYYYRVVAANAGGSVVSGTQSFRTLTEPVAFVGGNFLLNTTSVRVEGGGNAQGSDATVVFEYGTDGLAFPTSVAATPSTVTGDGNTQVSAVLTTLSQGTTYHYRVRATSIGGVGVSSSASFSMNVLSGLQQQFPPPPPESEGVLIVNLAPDTGVLHGWRFVGEQQWRASGVAAGGLATGDRDIEFRPVPGYNAPPQERVAIVSGAPALVKNFDYYHASALGDGSLIVTLKPDSVITGAGRAQWRFLGEDDSRWRDSGVTASGLVPGSHLIECKPVAGRATPPNGNVVIEAGRTTLATQTYFLADSPAGASPGVLAYETVTGDTDKPYAYVGQIRGDAGVGTGFVVKPRVVATAAHVVWNDGTLSAAQGLQWLFQRHRALHEPEPVTPRGFYLLDTYSGQRLAEGTPGFFSPQSQHLDVAAIYFTQNAGRGGYAGYLATDLADNEFLLSSANKMLVGYPVDGVPVNSQGRMHATPAMDVRFSAAFGRTFTTTDIRSSGGNSGGPLCVQLDGGKYYPAAICLGGSGQMVVRAIDSTVTGMLGWAETTANGGGGIVGGGASHTTVTPIDGGGRGAIRIVIEPAAARTAGAWWKLSPSNIARVSGAEVQNLTPGSYVTNLATLDGYQPPSAQHIPIDPNTLTTVTYTYQATLTPQQSWRQFHFGITANTGDAADTADPDHDGFNNLAEYTAGTLPTSAMDYLRSQNPTPGAGTFSLSTSGKTGRTYALERSTQLLPGSWATAATHGPLSADGTVTLTDPAAPATQAFYRIRVTGP